MKASVCTSPKNIVWDSEVNKILGNFTYCKECISYEEANLLGHWIVVGVNSSVHS